MTVRAMIPFWQVPLAGSDLFQFFPVGTVFILDYGDCLRVVGQCYGGYYIGIVIDDKQTAFLSEPSHGEFQVRPGGTAVKQTVIQIYA